ncbi:MAG: transposase [Candidatus Paceibacterota bacterium]
MELWHALNRGVDGRDLFMDDRDRLRFIHDLYEFDDTEPANPNVGYHFKSMDIVSPYINKRSRTRLVEIHGWCLMKNHYHLLMSELMEGGLSLFLRKLNVGYAKSFNEKYGRVGTLFQSRTKKILIENDAHFNYILHYIHLNPLDYLAGAEAWRERSHAGIANAKDALNYLEQYRWSSYLDYAGQKNFPSILTTSIFKDALGNYSQSLEEYLVGVTEDQELLRFE